MHFVVVPLLTVASLSFAEKPPKEMKIKVLDRVRLTVYCEDLEYVASGPLAGQLAILDESHVYGTRADGSGNSKVELLFDMPDVTGRPNGIAYVESLGCLQSIRAFIPTCCTSLMAMESCGSRCRYSILTATGRTLGWRVWPTSPRRPLLPVSTGPGDADSDEDTGEWYGHLQVIDLDEQEVRAILVPSSSSERTRCGTFSRPVPF